MRPRRLSAVPGPATWPTATHSDDVRQAEQDQRSPGGAVSERELDELFDKLVGALDDLGVEVDSFITAEQSLVGREVHDIPAPLPALCTSTGKRRPLAACEPKQLAHERWLGAASRAANPKSGCAPQTQRPATLAPSHGPPGGTAPASLEAEMTQQQQQQQQWQQRRSTVRHLIAADHGRRPVRAIYRRSAFC